jgi:hypothetical protein
MRTTGLDRGVIHIGGDRFHQRFQRDHVGAPCARILRRRRLYKASE